MNKELLRLKHGKTSGHELVLYADDRPSGFRLATVMATSGAEQVLHVVHLKAAEIGPLAHALIDALNAAG